MIDNPAMVHSKIEMVATRGSPDDAPLREIHHAQGYTQDWTLTLKFEGRELVLPFFVHPRHGDIPPPLWAVLNGSIFNPPHAFGMVDDETEHALYLETMQEQQVKVARFLRGWDLEGF